MRRIGVRFCGGCNPRYDRGAAFRCIKAQIDRERGDLVLEHAQEGQVYDGLLIIGGCQACCAGYDQFDNRGPVLKMYAASEVPDVIRRLMEGRTDEKDD